jgi:hypothetical protein
MATNQDHQIPITITGLAVDGQIKGFYRYRPNDRSRPGPSRWQGMANHHLRNKAAHPQVKNSFRTPGPVSVVLLGQGDMQHRHV